MTFKLPLHSAFTEVHRSNMTKEPKVAGDRCRDKGNGYTPPDLMTVLKEARA